MALPSLTTTSESASVLDAAIGVVGLGLIGSSISRRLLQSGAHVVGWDTEESQRAKAAEFGVHLTRSSQHITEVADLLLLCLPHDGIVHDYLNSVQLRPGQLIIDTSTGAAEAAERAWTLCRSFGVEYVDATISGSSAQLAAGQAVFMVGATESSWPRVSECLRRLVPAVHHVGPPGAGAKMKLVTNLVLGLNRAALAEGLAFASALELDLELTLKMFRVTPAYSRIMDTKGEKMIHGDFSPHARLSQHLKDVRLMLAAAGDLPLPLTAAHQHILETAEALGYGDADNSALIKFYGN